MTRRDPDSCSERRAAAAEVFAIYVLEFQHINIFVLPATSAPHINPRCRCAGGARSLCERQGLQRQGRAATWANERSRAARILTELQRAGYVLPLEQRSPGDERGRPAALYTLSGAALLAFAEA